MDLKVSIVIPYYNSGLYINEALQSIKLCPNPSIYEVIIVNDGTKDPYSLAQLELLEKQGYTIHHQTNKGPAGARNTGIRHALAEYILLLDSDNKIRPEYITMGIRILDENPDVGVVYGNPHFFGEVGEERFGKAEPFDITRMIVDNYIDNCSVIRKKVWEEVGGFDEARVLFGLEDWEFWLRVGQTQWKFQPVDEVLFDYRIRKGSMITQVTERHREALRYIHTKHQSLYLDCLHILHKELLDTRYLLSKSNKKVQRLEHQYYSFKISTLPLAKALVKSMVKRIIKK